LSGFRLDRPTTILDTEGNPVKGNWFGQSSFAEHSVISARNVIKVDPALPLELLGPLSCGVLTGAGAVFHSLAVEPGSSIAVFGTGTVGLAAVMAAHVAGAATVVAVDRNAERLKLAEEFGATVTFTTIDGLPTGLDYALDTTGAIPVLSAALDTLRTRGVLGCVGVQLKPFEIRPDQLARGRTIKGILEGDAVPKLLIPRIIDLWQLGRFPFDKLVTKYAFDDINSAEIDMKAGTVIKPVLVPGRTG
jgi:aryl-alcohol dehydrogenase